MKLLNVLLRFLPPFYLSITFANNQFVSGREEEELSLVLLTSHYTFWLASPNPPGLQKASRWWQSQSAKHPVKVNVLVLILTGQKSRESTQLQKATSECW